MCLWAASALWSGYRAVVQIFRLELDPVGGVLRGGSTVRARGRRGRVAVAPHPPPTVREARVVLAPE